MNLSLKIDIPMRVFSPNEKSAFGSVGEDINKIIDNEDTFLKERPLQPKRVIRNYFRENGFNVPIDFGNISEAMKFGKEFIFNSEHPQEYAGISGLAESYKVNPLEIIELQRTRKKEELMKLPELPEDLSERQINRKELAFEILLRIGYVDDEKIFDALMRIDERNFQDYANKLGLELKDILSEQSFSISEYITGINHTVVGDADIPGRYYIMSNFENRYSKIWYSDIIIIQDSKVIQGVGSYTKGDRKEGVESIDNRRIFDHILLISEYEKTRKLSRFDQNHFPIMEFQTSHEDGKQYNLQYHRCRDKNNVEQESFELNRPPRKGEVRAIFVRGATSPEGIVVRSSILYPFTGMKLRFPLLDIEEGGFGVESDEIFNEIMSRRRKVNFGQFGFGAQSEFVLLSLIDHISISEVFKSGIYIAIGGEEFEELFPDGLLRMIREISNGLNYPYQVNIRVVSDGNKSYIKLLTPLKKIEEDHKKYGLNVRRELGMGYVKQIDKFSIKTYPIPDSFS